MAGFLQMVFLSCLSLWAIYLASILDFCSSAFGEGSYPPPREMYS